MKAKDISRTQPTATFMMGGPASGKSTVRNRLFSELPAIDCDQIKESHPDYDPKDPSALHTWSSAEATRQAFHAIGEGADFLFDGTGTTSEKYVRFIQAAQEAGYVTELVYVACDLQTALERNRQRERTVPEGIVREKYSLIPTAFEIVSRYADKVRVIRN